MDETKIQAFEYIMYRGIEWYMDNINNFEVRNFNLLNDFSKKKIEFLPFFIFAASNNREKLIDLFDKFVCGETGIIEKDISSKLWNDFSFSNFNFFNSTNIATIIKQDYITEEGLFNQSKLEDYFKSNLSFEDRKMIDYSINALKYKNQKFINLEPEVFGFYSGRHTIWQVFKNIELKKEEKETILPKELLLNERSVFATKKDLLSFI